MLKNLDYEKPLTNIKDLKHLKKILAIGIFIYFLLYAITFSFIVVALLYIMKNKLIFGICISLAILSLVASIIIYIYNIKKSSLHYFAFRFAQTNKRKYSLLYFLLNSRKIRSEVFYLLSAEYAKNLDLIKQKI